MTHYDILGVGPKAPKAVIDAAHRVLARDYHPDKPDGDDVKMRAINEAHDILSDTLKREAYDAWLAQTKKAEKAKRKVVPVAPPAVPLETVLTEGGVLYVGMQYPQWSGLAQAAAPYVQGLLKTAIDRVSK